jgi:hypothetical protein
LRAYVAFEFSQDKVTEAKVLDIAGSITLTDMEIEIDVPQRADVTPEQRIAMIAAVTDIMRQYEEGTVDTTPPEASEYRFPPMPEGIRFPQRLEEEIGSGVASLMIYENATYGGYSVEIPCSAANGTVFMYVFLFETQEQPGEYGVSSVTFSEERF